MVTSNEISILVNHIVSEPVDIDFSPMLKVIGVFCLLGMGFLVMQLRKEYYWLQSIGGINTLYDVDDI